MFGTILSVIFTLLLTYIIWRLASVPLVARLARRRVVLGVDLVLCAFFWISRSFAHDAVGRLAIAADFVAMILLATVFLVSVAVLAVDLFTAFGLLFRNRAPSWRGWAVLAGLALSIIALVQGFRAPAVSNYEIRLRGLPPDLDGTVLVGVSDMHLGTLLGARWLEDRLVQVAALKPDLVVLLGDIYEGHGRPSPELLEPWRRLSPPFGVWFVPGNHEMHGGGAGIDGLLAELGIHVLHEKWAQIRPGLILAGVDDLGRHRPSEANENPIGRALAGRPEGATVLLSHSPLMAEKAAGAGVGLMLSGHTHGGQIWPFGWLLRTRYPAVAGLVEVQGMPLIVGRGTGTWGPRMRLWHRGEILRITLRAS